VSEKESAGRLGCELSLSGKLLPLRATYDFGGPFLEIYGEL
jgi:hypothetical protein